MPRRFRITSLSDPEGQGLLNVTYLYRIDFEYDPGEPYNTNTGRLIISLKDNEAYTIASGTITLERYKSIANARIAHLATQRLTMLLSSPDPELDHLITPAYDEIRSLLEINPNRVQFGDWVDIHTQIVRNRNRVFISCGQRTDEEQELGENISNMISEITGLDGYFAEYQSSLEGLTANIFNAIYESAAFIAVMHRRDNLSSEGDQYRGSVWIEQEIAIASFIVQSLGISLPSRAYIQNGVTREGVRGYIILNPIEFNSTQEILDDLGNWLPSLLTLQIDG